MVAFGWVSLLVNIIRTFGTYFDRLFEEQCLAVDLGLEEATSPQLESGDHRISYRNFHSHLVSATSSHLRVTDDEGTLMTEAAELKPRAYRAILGVPRPVFGETDAHCSYTSTM